MAKFKVGDYVVRTGVQSSVWLEFLQSAANNGLSIGGFESWAEAEQHALYLKRVGQVPRV